MNEQIKAIRNEIERRYSIYKAVSKPGIEDINTTAMRELEEILSFIDSRIVGIPQFDEAYLNECIAKASKTWDGVDVNKYMDEVRGNRPKSSDNSLEDEIINYWGRIPEDKDLVDTARHFAKWGAEHAKIDVTDFCKPIDPGIAQCIADHFWEMLGEDEKPVPNDLEEAAENYIAPIENDEGLDYINFNGRDIKDAFIAGAEWQKKQRMDEWLQDRDGCFWDGVEEGKKAMKEQMMKDAVEGEYDCQYMTPAVFLDKYLDGTKDGDKVRIIIVKED